MARTFMITVFGMTLLAAFVLAATLDQGAQASSPTGLDVLQAITAPAATH